MAICTVNWPLFCGANTEDIMATHIKHLQLSCKQEGISDTIHVLRNLLSHKGSSSLILYFFMCIWILIVLDVPTIHWGTQGKEPGATTLWAMGVEADRRVGKPVTRRIASKTYSGYGRCWKSCPLSGKCFRSGTSFFFTGQMRETELKYWALVEEKLGEISAGCGIFFGIVWTSCTGDRGFNLCVLCWRFMLRKDHKHVIFQ
jgi:hypothetical protein